jgi:AbrB family looped-hinge helix DNA binding protein
MVNGIVDGMKQRLKIDAAGRIVIPLPVREHFHLAAGALLDLQVEEGKIILRPREQAEPLIEGKGGLLAHDGEPTGDLLNAVESARMRRDRHNLGPAR